MKFEIKNRFTGSVIFTAELSADYESKTHGIQLGAAVKLALMAGTNLAYADLTYADLTGTNLTGTNLTWAKLTDADLTWADLTYANLAYAALIRAKLTYADMTCSDLTRADLTRANLADADMTGAKLTGADLTGTNLTGTDLTGSDAEKTTKGDAHTADWWVDNWSVEVSYAAVENLKELMAEDVADIKAERDRLRAALERLKMASLNVVKHHFPRGTPIGQIHEPTRGRSVQILDMALEKTRAELETSHE